MKFSISRTMTERQSVPVIAAMAAMAMMVAMAAMVAIVMMATAATVRAQTPRGASGMPGVPDAAAGQKRAAVCFACHNENGVATIPGTPNLAGQHADYLESALHAYRDGRTRQNPAMNAMAQPLSDADIANIAAYYSRLRR